MCLAHPAQLVLPPSWCAGAPLGATPAALLLLSLLLLLPEPRVQRRLMLFVTTAMLLSAIMPPASEGLSAMPYSGSSAPAAMGTPTKL